MAWASACKGGLSTAEEKRLCNIVLFKSTDLRTHDHEPLFKAHREGVPVLHLFVFDPWFFEALPLTGLPRTGAVRTRFLLESIKDLRKNLEEKGQDLVVRHGRSTEEELVQLCARFDVRHVYTYQEVCDEELRMEKRIARAVGPTKLVLCSGFTLFHIDDLTFDPAHWFPHTYSAFRRKVEGVVKVRSEFNLDSYRDGGVPLVESSGSLPTLCELGVDVHRSEYDRRAAIMWQGGETAALRWLTRYVWLDNSLRDYVGATNTMGKRSVLPRAATTKLSPWLAHGCLSPRRLYSEIERYERQRVKNKSTYWLKHELVWRDYLRFGVRHWGTSIFKLGGIPSRRSKPDAPRVPWSRDRARLQLWVDGQTGYPFCDAFMRELCTTGYTSHMGRECAAWFLVRDLQIDWRMGAEVMQHYLVDHEPSANWGNWAYRIAPTAVHGVGEEACSTPEMLLWARQHDPEARHIKRWCPELASLPPEHAREPWRLLCPGSPAFAQAWECAMCTVCHPPSAARACDLCGHSRAVCLGDFEYGVVYPTPVVKPVLLERRAELAVVEDSTPAESASIATAPLPAGVRPEVGAAARWASPVARGSSAWQCHMCTFVNQNPGRQCGVCFELRPVHDTPAQHRVGVA